MLTSKKILWPGLSSSHSDEERVKQAYFMLHQIIITVGVLIIIGWWTQKNYYQAIQFYSSYGIYSILYYTHISFKPNSVIL